MAQVVQLYRCLVYGHPSPHQADHPAEEQKIVFYLFGFRFFRERCAISRDARVSIWEPLHRIFGSFWDSPALYFMPNRCHMGIKSKRGYRLPNECQTDIKIKRPIGLLILVVGWDPNKDALVSDWCPFGVQNVHFGNFWVDFGPCWLHIWCHMDARWVPKSRSQLMF